MGRKRKIVVTCKATPIRLTADFSVEIVGTSLVVHLSHQRSPKYTGMGSLSLLQEVFPTQKSNPGLLHCRWILYCVNHQRSPFNSSVQSLSCVQLFAAPWTAARQASLSIINSQSLLKLMSIESVMPSNHLIVCHPFLFLQSFPASGSFPK